MSNFPKPIKLVLPDILPEQRLIFNRDEVNENVTFFIRFLRTAFAFDLNELEPMINDSHPLDMNLLAQIFYSFVVHCKRMHFTMDDDLFDAMFITCFGHKTPEQITTVVRGAPRIIPVPQLTLSAHFNNVWRHCVVYLASLCQLRSFVPELEYVFSSAMFCTLSMHFQGTILEPEVVAVIDPLVDATIREFKDFHEHAKFLLKFA